MLFKNLILYRLPKGFSLAASDLEAALDRRPLQACGSFDMQTRGFVACGYEQRTLYTQGQQHLLCLGVEQKLLPASIINQVAKERALELEQQQGHPVGRRQMRELKARVGDELRARALTRRRTTFAWLDLPGGWLAVNTASNSRAEELVETLRDALGTLPVTPFDTQHAPAGSMAAWLTHGDAPGRFMLGEDLELSGHRRQRRHDPLRAPPAGDGRGAQSPGLGQVAHAARAHLERPHLLPAAPEPAREARAVPGRVQGRQRARARIPTSSSTSTSP